MRKIHELMIQDVILTHRHLYESEQKCGWLTDKDTRHCSFKKEFLIDVRYPGARNNESIQVHVLQKLTVNENEYPYNRVYTYAHYEIEVQVGFMTKVYTGAKAIKELSALLTLCNKGEYSL